MLNDHIPYLPDTDYFFLGNGRVMAAIQWSRNAQASPYGILLCDPERMSRKNGSLLFHPELGLSRTMLTVTVDGVRHRPDFGAHAAWDLNRSQAVVVRWDAGPASVTERFTVQNNSALVRDVWIAADTRHEIQVEAALYANPLFFDEFGVRNPSELYASGYTSINLYSIPEGQAFERFLCVPAAADRSQPITFVYTIEAVGTHEFALYPADRHAPPPLVAVNGGGDEPATLESRIERQYAIARSSLRACVSALGKFDAAIWQYDFEWGLDAAMVANAASLCGQFEVARAVLLNILRRLSNAGGSIAEASRFRDGEMAELNGNGAVLDALWTYWRWSGDASLIESFWERIHAIAEYPLRAEFAHESGLLRGRRDLWERTPWMGVREGFELGHQSFCALGLRRAAEMAGAHGHGDDALRWQSASERIGDAMLNDEKYSLVHEGRFIHRRLVDGSVQRMMRPETYPGAYAPYVPAAAGPELPCEPDVAEALPIVHGLVDPRSPIAQATLEALEALWSPTGTGGYARYNVASDPDSPGPWPFATAFMAAAELEAGMIERARRSIEWLLASAGAGGSWFEYYGERQSPPHPPIGIIVWGWAQFVILVTHHIVGARIEGDELVLAPRMSGIEHQMQIGAHTVTVSVRGLRSARIDGAVADFAGQVRIPLPLRADCHAEFLP